MNSVGSPTFARVLDPPLLLTVQLVSLAVLLASGLVDMAGALQLGPLSAQAILTICYFGAGMLLYLLVPSTAPLQVVTIPLCLFISWAILSLVWTPALKSGVQNVLVIGTFIILMLLAASTSANSPAFAFLVERNLNRAATFASVLYVLTLLLDGLGTNQVIGARSFGLFALFGVALHLSKWRYRNYRGLVGATLITLVIGASLSRLALGIAVLLFPLSQLPSRGLTRIVKAFAILIAVGICSYAAVLYVQPLQERFLSGDVSLKIGSLGINVSGRLAFWRVTLDSLNESPVFGKGAGSTEALIEAMFVEIRHPHSDYLRIAHDYGIFGLALWIVSVGSLLFRLWTSWRVADKVKAPSARLHLTAFLALIAFSLQMTMENALVYVFVAAPLGLLVGASLGLDRRGIHAHPNFA